MPLDLHTVESPIGRLVLGAQGDELVALHLPGSSEPPPVGTPRTTAVLAATARQLSEYFGGMRTTFELPLAFSGTDFQRSVWTALLAIPYAATTTYGALAAKLGRPTASRAVGAANGSNPIAIIVPCHRVIGSGGSLTGYGGGLAAKQFLLALEQRAVQPSLF